MERSSPLAALQPSCMQPSWSRSLPDFDQKFLCPSRNFNFKDLSMLKSKSDYFAFQPIRGSSPTASLAADLSQNFHIDQTYVCPIVLYCLSSNRPKNLTHKQSSSGNSKTLSLHKCRRSRPQRNKSSVPSTQLHLPCHCHNTHPTAQIPCSPHPSHPLLPCPRAMPWTAHHFPTNLPLPQKSKSSCYQRQTLRQRLTTVAFLWNPMRRLCIAKCRAHLGSKELFRPNYSKFKY